jgi:hypothetical protein
MVEGASHSACLAARPLHHSLYARLRAGLGERSPSHRLLPQTGEVMSEPGRWVRPVVA